MKYILLILIFILSGCTTKLPSVNSSSKTTYVPQKKQKEQVPTKTIIKPKQSSDLDKLYAVYNEWHGTPYKYGGVSLSGADCSGFVLNAYKKVYGIKLPRSTKDQVKVGRVVYMYELKAGDLLFFKTGWNVRHVGIYLENGKFMHASSSKGVTTSSIRENYWKDKYWQTRRLF